MNAKNKQATNARDGKDDVLLELTQGMKRKFNGYNLKKTYKLYYMLTIFPITSKFILFIGIIYLFHKAVLLQIIFP